MGPLRQGFFKSTALILMTANASLANARTVEFCEYGENPVLSEKMVIDVDERLAIGTDTRFSLLPLIDNEVIGFESPFPLVVPKKGEDVERWASSNYDYTITALKNDDWIVIHADPINKDGNYTSSSALFSQLEGVISLRVSRHFSGETFTTSFYRCGTEKFFPEELAGE